MPSHASTIYVDIREKERVHPKDKSRTTGTDMLALLKSHRDAVKASGDFLTAGDFCFSGNGPKGPALIGIERKRLSDMLSSLRTQRFVGEQLPKLINHYEFIYLVIEGRFRTNWYTGMIEERWGKDWTTVSVGSQQFLGLELDSFLNSLSVSPVRVRHTRDEKETIEFVVSLHHTFSKPWDEHAKKLVGIHTPPEYALVGKASTVRRGAYALTGIGWERSGAVEQHFSSIADMCAKDVPCPEHCGYGRYEKTLPREYEKIDGFGKVLSKRIVAELHGEYEAPTKGGFA